MGKLSEPVLKYLQSLFAVSDRVRKTYYTGYQVSLDLIQMIFWVILDVTSVIFKVILDLIPLFISGFRSYSSVLSSQFLISLWR